MGAATGLPEPLKRSRPVWVAPMAGGPSHPELVIAAEGAGHFAQLAAGYKTAEAMSAEIREVREVNAQLFGVNLFVPNVHRIGADEYETYARSLQPTVDRIGAGGDTAVLREDDDDWEAKIAALVETPVPVVSFTFGLPPTAVVEQLHRAGSVLLQTVTSVDEAVQAEAAGLDVLIVQGSAAGGHSGIWAANELPRDIPLGQLVEEVRAAVTLPIAAAGGIATAADVRDATAAGADAVMVGTAVLRAPESGASDAHKAALADPRFTTTTLTRAFTGRPARALVNQFVLDHDGDAPSGYPAVHHLTRPLRAAAARAGDPSALNLWAGEQWSLAQDAPVTRTLAELDETEGDPRSPARPGLIA